MNTNLLGGVKVDVPVDPSDYIGRPEPLSKSWIFYFDITPSEVTEFLSTFRVGGYFEGKKITEVEIRNEHGELYS